MAKPAKKAYSLKEISSEWTKLCKEDVTEDDVIQYASDGILTLHALIARNRCAVVNEEALNDVQKAMVSNGCLFCLNAYAQIVTETASILLDGTISLRELYVDGMILVPEGGCLNISRKDIYVLHEDRIKFEQSLSDAPTNNEKPLATNERNSLLTIIAALCEYSDITYKERGAASQIAKLTEEIGAAVSHETVKRHLDKIPDALESRMK